MMSPLKKRKEADLKHFNCICFKIYVKIEIKAALNQDHTNKVLKKKKKKGKSERIFYKQSKT